MSKEKYIVFDIETTGLRPWFGDAVTCICAKDSDGKIFKEHADGEDQEVSLLKKFHEWVEKREGFVFITHNGLGFDIPFILTRCAIRLDKQYFAAFLKHRINFDIMKIARKWISLDDLSTLFSCKEKSGTGANAIDLYEDRKFDELEKYCMNDVEITEDIYLTYHKLREEKS